MPFTFEFVVETQERVRICLLVTMKSNMFLELIVKVCT